MKKSKRHCESRLRCGSGVFEKGDRLVVEGEKRALVIVKFLASVIAVEIARQPAWIAAG